MSFAVIVGPRATPVRRRAAASARMENDASSDASEGTKMTHDELLFAHRPTAGERHGDAMRAGAIIVVTGRRARIRSARPGERDDG